MINIEQGLSLLNSFDHLVVRIQDFYKHTVVFNNRKKQLEFAYDVADKNGHVLEFGVYKGNTICFLGNLDSNRKIYGFDSFEGLPEKWMISEDNIYDAGHFGVDQLPAVPRNVSLVKGYFSDSLPTWLENHKGHVSLLHIDSDLYSSASYILENLTDRIVAGTVIVFDELSDWGDKGKVSYTQWPEGEWKALLEFMREHQWKIRILSRDRAYASAIQIIGDKELPTDFLSRQAQSLWDFHFKGEALHVQERLLRETGKTKLGDFVRYLGWKINIGEFDWVLGEVDGYLGSPLSADNDLKTLVPLKRLKARALYRKGAYRDAKLVIKSYLNSEFSDYRDYSLLANINYDQGDFDKAYNYYCVVSRLRPSDANRKRIRECRWRMKLRSEFAQLQFSALILQEILDRFDFRSVLDIGAGDGAHSEIFENHGKEVTQIDLGGSPYYNKGERKDRIIKANFLEYQFDRNFDCVWASHILEHQPNVNLFLRRVHSVLKDNGVLAITVPPYKKRIVGGHLTVWNAGLLLYNLVLAGFDCKEAIIRSYGYNVSIAVRKKDIQLPELVMDSGDIDAISEYLPDGLQEGFNGELPDRN